MFWRHASYAGAVVGLGGGLLIQIALALGLWAADAKLHWLYAGAIAQVLTRSCSSSPFPWARPRPPLGKCNRSSGVPPGFAPPATPAPGGVGGGA